MKLHRCQTCGRRRRRRECVYHEDPLAPLGPEWKCPACGGLVQARSHPLILVGGVIVGGVLGAVAAWLLA
jgi:hypothetical protein